MNDKVDARVKTAILDLDCASCASCAYAIEHAGRKVPGVSDVFVDISVGEARVEYSGNDGALERIAQIVRSLGHDATVRAESIRPTEK